MEDKPMEQQQLQQHHRQQQLVTIEGSRMAEMTRPWKKALDLREEVEELLIYATLVISQEYAMRRATESEKASKSS